MSGLWASMVPLVVGSAFVPIQIIVTVLLLRSRAGRITAVAWMAGMSTVRILQGVAFGAVLSQSSTVSSQADGPSVVASVLLLVLAIAMYVMALKEFRKEDDPDAPPPKWLAKVDTVTPPKAFLAGAALMLLGPKFWVFTLSAISVIGEADLGQPGSAVAFGVFVVGAASVHLALIALAYLAPERAGSVLDSFGEWLQAKSSVIVIVLGIVFGSWFMAKALTGLGVI